MTAIWKSPAGAAAVRERYRAFLSRWPVAHEQLSLTTRHGDTFVVASGPKDAPAVVLLHGSASNSAMWMGDVGAWAQRFRVYAVDVIGEPGLSADGRPSLASGAYAEWLDDLFAGLGLRRAALVGISLGGWLALDYASRRPERVSALALLCPGGVGRHKNVLLWAGPLLLLGPWGRRLVTRRIAGPRPAGPVSPVEEAFGGFMQLIFANFRPRHERLPRFSDAALARLAMPTLCVLGARDAMIDSAGTRERLARNAPHAEISWLPDAGHFLAGQTAPIAAFLGAALAEAAPDARATAAR
jgi:pimeloyl-ACP methyl ester carboxylesterase